MHTHDIRSIGTLNNADGSIALTLSLHGQMTPVFVSVSPDELEHAGGIQAVKENKKRVIDWYNNRGPGRRLNA